MNVRKKILALVLLGSLMLTAGCSGESTSGSKPTEPEETTKPTETVVTTAATEPEDPLEALREEMAGTTYTFAVAYAGDTYEEGQRDAAALLSDLAPELCRQWPFLMEIPTENIVDLGWGEIYCIIPTDPEATIRVSRAVEQEYGYWDYTEVVYESSAGEPILLICNSSAYWPDAQVVVTSRGVETYWCPRLDKYQRADPLADSSGKPLFLDISSYTELFTLDYLDIAEWEEYRPPVKDELVGTAWGWEGVALYDDLYTTYLLAFEENTAFIRWNDGVGEEDHEIRDIPWELTHVDGYAVLTLDLGEFAGVRSYNLLYAQEYGWLYTIVDLSSGEVTVGDEIPYRFLERRSLGVPEPVEMVGTWERFRWEAEGYVEEDTSGTCTIVIAGQTEDTLTISYTDRERPNFNYQDKALDVRQGVIYEGCGNSLWLAEVGHVGPWDTTYTVTLLEDGTLMVQNYFLLDGAPTVSYEWYCRAEYGDSMSPYAYALSQGWRLPELWELEDSFWLSDMGYALELMDDSVPDDQSGWAKIYDVGEYGEYTESYNGSWTYADGMLYLSLVPRSDDGYWIDDSFPVLMLDGELWIGRNEYGLTLPHFGADQMADVLTSPKG